MKELKFKVSITVKSVRGISVKEALGKIAEMEIMANQKGDPRFHIWILECPEENFYVES